MAPVGIARKSSCAYRFANVWPTLAHTRRGGKEKDYDDIVAMCEMRKNACEYIVSVLGPALVSH